MNGRNTMLGGKGLSLPLLFPFLSALTLISLCFVFFVVSGCGHSDPKPKAAVPLDAPLKIGILSTRGVLALSVAEQMGYFEHEGLDVQLVPFQSAAEKDAAFQAGAIDGMFSDLVAATLLRAHGEDLKVVSLIAGGGADEGRVAIVAAPNSQITCPQDLSGHDIALSRNTIMEFVTDDLLSEVALDDAIVKVPIAKTHLRLSMLLEGKVSAAVLPEPLITLAQTQGARVILDDQRDGRCFLVLAFRQQVLDDRGEAVERAFIAYNRAVDDINCHPKRHRDALIAVARVPDDIHGVVRVTRYCHWQVPTRGQVERVLYWLQGRSLVKGGVKYRRLVDDRFIHNEDMRCAKVWKEQQLAKLH